MIIEPIFHFIKEMEHFMIQNNISKAYSASDEAIVAIEIDLESEDIKNVYIFEFSNQKEQSLIKRGFEEISASEII